MKNFIFGDFKRRSMLYTFWSIICFFTLGAMQEMYGQTVPLETSVHANFGVDADIHSGLLSFDTNGLNEVGTDDWVQGATGLGVIDETDAATIAQLAAGDNIQALFRMSVPINTVVNGDTWLDAVYLRDQNTKGGNMDMTVFGGGDDKNFDDPTTWTVKEGDVPQKNDIIDVYAHLRRDSDQPPPFNYLWAFASASTRSPNGNNYIDFEYFRLPVTYDAVNEQLVTAGPDCGHTAYSLDAANGAVIIDGDIIVSTNYTNGGAVADIRLYAWINSDDINGLDGDPTTLSNDDYIAYNLLPQRRFNFGDGVGGYEFYNCNNDTNIPYGYARISLRSDVAADPIFAQDNTSASVSAPSWGTIDPGGSVTPDYVAPTFAEFGLNATVLGLDASQSSGICQAPLGSVIVKTRSSTSFTSELKDLAGPFELGDTPEYTVTISGGNITCTIECVELTATALPPGAYTYEWFKDGVVIPGESGSTIIVCEVGFYTVKATLPGGCTAESPPFEVIGEYDEIPPVITCPADEQLECTEDVPAPDISLVTATDNDGFPPTITHVGDVVSLDDCGLETVTRTYRATDACENTADCTQVFTIVDTTPPVITCPGDMDFECTAGDSGVATATDNCDDNPTVTWSDSVSTDNCGLDTTTRTWTATDCSGNSSSCVQVITEYDTTPPVITCPGDMDFECTAGDSGVATATDNCDDNPTVTWSDSVSTDNCGLDTITRTWTATDCSGNSSSCVQVITEYDTTPPVITCPGDMDFECTAGDSGVATATDNCDDNPTVTWSDSVSTDNCGLDTITRTWTATDCSGNSSSCVQVITEYDTTPPVITCPGDMDFECTAGDSGVATATDNCDDNPTVTWSDSVSTDNCGLDTITRTWTATDCSGNSSSCVQVITEYDTTPPVITCPGDMDFECTAGDSGVATATDNCDDNPTVTWSDSVSTDNCGLDTITRTWTATDCSGNSSSCVQVITEYDTTPPVITCPGDMDFECTAGDSGVATATDNCDDNPTVTWSDSVSTDNCGLDTITRTWTATDCSGNSSSCVQVITEYDTTPPVITCPGDMDFECTAGDSGVATATDNCDDNPTVTWSDSVSTDNCGLDTITRTWTATDCSGNSSSCVQVITEYDTTPPVITCPGDMDFECTAGDSGVATATDNCDDNPTVTWSDSVSTDNCGLDTITRTWTATDCSGNFATCVQVITEYDTTPPVIVCPADAVFDCVGGDGGTATATDNCDDNPTVTSSDVVDLDACGQGTITRTWRATDCAGNYSECVQLITVKDDTPPVITCPADASYQCEEGDSGVATATDNCDDNPVITWTDSSDGLTCPETITRTWRATDCAGNFSECVQTITIDDTEDPVLVVPAGFDIECNGEFPATLTATWTDNCSGSGELTVGPVITVDGCIEYADYNFYVEDDCENSASGTVKLQREIEMIENCETAFGKLRDGGQCFNNVFSRWGWTNEITSEGQYELDLYAGAAHCNVDNGALVGSVSVDYTDGFVTVTYNVDAGYTMSEVHLYMGCEQYPTKPNGAQTVAPGQYNFNPGPIDYVSSYTIGPIEASGSFWLIAHAVTCEVMCMCSDPESGEFTPDDYEPIECEDHKPVNKSSFDVDFKAYPVPFKDVVNISYEFDFDTDVSIEIIDMHGFVIENVYNNAYSRNSVETTQFDLSRFKDQMLFVKVSTAAGTAVKQIISTNNKR